MTRPTQPRRAFTIIVALSMIALVSLALVLVGRLVVADAKRTQQEMTDAQLRLLLMAGTGWAATRAEAAGDLSPPITLPSELADATLVIATADASSDGELSLRITATLLDRTQSQTVRLARAGDRWRIAAAELEPAHAAIPAP